MLLDSVRAWSDGIELDLGSPQQCATLALLLLNEGRPVSTDELIHALWGESAPKGARGTLRTYIYRLRRVLLGRDEDAIIESTTNGYVLRVDPKAVDLGLFRLLVAEARIARDRGDRAEAVDRFWDALALWQGTPLAGIHGSYVDEWRARLDQVRIAALEELLELQLDLGRHSDVIEEVLAALAVEPLRERLRELLMLALYRSGRQAEALVVYEQARKLARTELRGEPGRGLQELHQRILRSDPDLLAAVTPPPTPETGVLTPAQLPADLPAFVGRQDVLAEVLALLADKDEPSPDTVVGVVSGMAGVGKTAFAVRWAHRVAHHFPDGQLYVNMRGFDEDDATLESGDVILSFLDALGVPPHRIPTDLEAQAALYRSVLTQRRCLILLDNVRDTEHVRLLLPGVASCLTIVTSRRQLSGLVAFAGAHPVTLGLLSVKEGNEFLTQRLGADRVGAEPQAARKIADLCTRLPLALAIVSARAAFQPNFPLAVIAAELAATRGSLDGFAGTDSTVDVRAVFSWSYRALTPAAARMFRLLSMHNGGAVTVRAAASLAALPPRSAHAVLQELASMNLLTEQSPGRYAWHDLLRNYAREHLDADEHKGERRIESQRLLEYYVHSADAGFRHFSTYSDLRPLPPHLPDVCPERFTSYEQAMDWFVTEYSVLLSVISQAATNGFHALTTRLAWALNPFQNRKGHWHDLVTTQRVASEAARQLDDETEIAFVHDGIARGAALFGDYKEAHHNLDQSFALLDETGDDLTMAYHHSHRATVYEKQGDYARSLHHTQQALELCRSASHRMGEAAALNNAAWLNAHLGDHEQAISHCREALVIFESLDNPLRQADTLDSLGYAYHRLGQYEQAIESYQQALALLRALDGSSPDQVAILANLAETYLAVNRRADARSVLTEATAMIEELDLPRFGRVRIMLLGLGSAEAASYSA